MADTATPPAPTAPRPDEPAPAGSAGASGQPPDLAPTIPLPGTPAMAGTPATLAPSASPSGALPATEQPSDAAGDAAPPQGHAGDASASTPRMAPLLHTRLSADAMTLELCLTPASRQARRDELAQALVEQCRALGLQPEVSSEQALEWLRRARVGAWAIVARGTPASPPVNGAIAFLIQPPPPAPGQWFHPRVPIRRGQAIIRITPARDGQPGHDLRGRALPAATARQQTIPAGENTAVGDDGGGPALIAQCDGSLVLDHLKVTVHPAHIIDAATLSHTPGLEVAGDLFVVDRVPPRSYISAGGDIFVAGDVDAATLISRRGSITVLGCVTGYHAAHCTLEAAGDVNLVSVLHADVTARGNGRIQTQARNSILTIGGQLYLLSRLRHAFYDVELRVQGAIIPVDQPSAPPDVAPTERNAFLIPCQIEAMVALYDPVSVTFQPCAIAELSVASARLVVQLDAEGRGLPSNRAVLLRFGLPGVSSPVAILARTMESPGRGVVPVMFRQLSHQDEAHVTAYCLALLRAHNLQTHHADEAPPPAQSNPTETPLASSPTGAPTDPAP